jgi:hypothetical protein
MFGVKCPRCGMSTSISLVESTYKGPFRCWKCKAPFLVNIEDEELKSCKPISEEELQRYLD